MSRHMHKYPHINPAKPLMVVVDTSVFLHRLDQKITRHHLDPQFEGLLKANLVWLMSGAWLGHDLRPLMANMVFCLDMKPYWRSEWLENIENVAGIPSRFKAKQKLSAKAQEILGKKRPTDEELETLAEAEDKLSIKYKGGRKLPSYRFRKIKKLVIKWLQEIGASTLWADGYEADDMAASLVKVNSDKKDPWNILLLTVDTDWLGLINPSVTWVCMAGYHPVVRDTIEVVNLWAEKQLKTELETWRDIWDIKGWQGDKSDNLPASGGKLLPVIDLLNPPDRYKYWLKNEGKVSGKFINRGTTFSLEKALEAKKYILALGEEPAVRFLPGADIYPPEPRQECAIELVDLEALLEQVKDLPTEVSTPVGLF